ncbi:MAG TPA: DUF1549 and DUF1553 domain-containing protein, partial [Pirellulaceae bacterium]|nr:DUF1549 and DUF1553 domain-containing protein [Pirellulaceae bacterium]
KPIARPTPPSVADGPWARDEVDRFIRARLDAERLAPAPPADPIVLLRRLSFVLTGLPPRPLEVREFQRTIGAAMATPEPQRAAALEHAYVATVDRLLKSPHFGERFARYWMDVVRYTDTYGYEWDNPAKGSHEYRDYLIRAFNDDVGFDRLVREQVAGDLLPQARIHPTAGTQEQMIGPMFYHMGEHRHGSSLMFNGIHQEMVNNKIDAFSKSLLATTVACARCHDHKLEAVSQRDYYSLAAVFTTPRWTSRVIDAPGKHDAAIGRLIELRGEIRRELARTWRETKFTRDALRAVLGDAAALAAAKPAIHDVAYPIARLAQRDADAPAAWKELAAEWRTAVEQRKKANAAFKTLADFREPTIPAGWVTEGDGMKFGHVADGTPLVALEGDAVVARLLPRGYHTHALSSKLPGALRMPPQHLVPGNLVSVNVAGGEFGGYLVMDGHAFQNETVTFLSQNDPQWKSFADARLTNGVQQVTVEFATSSLNPNFPPRTGLAKGLANSDFGYDKRSWISITGIVTHDGGGVPQDELAAFATLYGATKDPTNDPAKDSAKDSGKESATNAADNGANDAAKAPAKDASEAAAPADADAVWRGVAEWLSGAVRRWCDEKPEAGDREVVDWLLAKKLLANQTPADSRLAKLVAEYRSTEATIAFPRTINSMDERDTTRAVYPLNVRGNVDVLGPAMKPDFLQMFSGRHQVSGSAGSGRLELAESLVDPEHPLTSRVYVNRVWQWVFGTGLVATPDDFGHLGDKPSHPELLDWLAREFTRDGWSTKRLVRRLVLTQTFRQSGDVSAAARERDPDNRLLHHYPTRRLEAEAIRDSLLAVSGRLDPSLYGRPILPPRTVEDGAKRLYSGPVDGNGRRSIYLQMSIMAPPPFLVGFNLPDLKLPTGRRDVTNVPSQALVLLNDPFVTAMAKHWAGRLVQENHASVDERLQAMFVTALGREPTDAERSRWQAALADFAGPNAAGGSDAKAPESKEPKDPKNLLKDELLWQRVAHSLFNTKEFIYYR